MLQIFYANWPPAVIREAQESRRLCSTRDGKLRVYSQKKCLIVLNLNFLKVFFFLYNIFIGS